jgi:transportin-1
MRLTPNDISGLDSRFQSSKSNNLSKLKDRDEDNDEDIEDDENVEGYNPNWTLRKCCSKFIDKLSNIFPQHVFEIIKPVLENDIQHPEWIIKERSILCLGAIGIGCYPYLKPHLSNLISFLIKELQHPNKLVRAISCWTLSR